jgi:DNA-binding transcriptional ArsR family regulator
MNSTVDIAPVAEIERLEALKVLSDGQRHRMLTLLMDEALTARELSQRLGIGRTRLYHHLGLLERHGLIRVAERRVVSGIEERTYRAAARTFRVDRNLLATHASEPEIAGAQAAILESMAADLRVRSIGYSSAATIDESEILVARAFLRLNDARRRELRAKLSALIAEYRTPDPDGRETECGLALYTTHPEAL